MVKKYKLYIFDLDGTLLDSDQMIIETFHELHRMYSPADFAPDDNVLITYSGPPIRESLKNEFPELDQEEILKVWRERSLKNYPKYTRLFPNVIEALTKLKNEGAKIAIRGSPDVREAMTTPSSARAVESWAVDVSMRRMRAIIA